MNYLQEKSIHKVSTLKITSKNKVKFQNDIESPQNIKNKDNLLKSENSMKRLLKIKTYNSRHHKKKYLFLNTKKNYEITTLNKDLAFLKYPTVKTSPKFNKFIYKIICSKFI